MGHWSPARGAGHRTGDDFCCVRECGVDVFPGHFVLTHDFGLTHPAGERPDDDGYRDARAFYDRRVLDNTGIDGDSRCYLQ